jgi:hypothetical protein
MSLNMSRVNGAGNGVKNSWIPAGSASTVGDTMGTNTPMTINEHTVSAIIFDLFI